MQDISVAIIQTKLEWENTDANLSHFNKLLSQIETHVDLIVLPEMFSTAFSMNPEKYAEPMSGKAMTWLKEKAKEKNCTIVGSIMTEDSGKFYNRLTWMSPDGSAAYYDKKHLFRFAGEHMVFSGGKKNITTTLKEWKFRPQICFDLRFPVWNMNTFENGNFNYDCLLIVANWPERRRDPWISLLVARAIENQSYVIGVNRVGADGNGIAHSGDSMIVDPHGKIICQAEPHKESIETATLSASVLKNWRDTFPVARDWDKFKIED